MDGYRNNLHGSILDITMEMFKGHCKIDISSFEKIKAEFESRKKQNNADQSKECVTITSNSSPIPWINKLDFISLTKQKKIIVDDLIT